MTIPTKMSAGLFRFCDASKWQGDMDWSKAASRLDFAYAKMSQAKFLDPQWKSSYLECGQLDFPLGAYHYYDTSVGWLVQADYYLYNLDIYDTLLYPVVDLEMTRPAPRVADILNFLAELMDELQVLPIIYSGPSFILQYLQLPEFSQFPLWISHYATDKRWPLSAPRVPLPWFAMDWWGWQFSADGNNQGAYYGSTGNKAIDLNVAWSIPWMPGREP